MSTLLVVLSSILASIIFLFFYWRALRDDYNSETIFSSAFEFFLGIFIGGVLFKYFLSKLVSGIPIFRAEGFWFWGACLGFLFSLIWTTYRKKMRFFETFEASSLGLLFWLMTIFLTDFIILNDFYSLAGLAFILFCIFLLLFLRLRYKKFWWYKSGRVGFSSLATFGVFFLVRSLVATQVPSMLSFIGKADAVLSAAVAFLLFFGLYNLAQVD